MADLPNLSRLVRIPVRDVWAHEAHQFTQWMLENADVLSDLLGMDLEMTAAEHRVGGFALDLIGKDLQTGDTVIVENQLEATDHGHLGQLLTYAGGTDPATIVWCAPKFRDEHRAALDWLNDHTDEGIRFFGIEIAAVRIGESDPAPFFSLVAQPNDWSKRVHTEKAAATTPMTQRSQANYLLWQRVLGQIHQTHPNWTSARTPTRENWIALPFGTSWATYSLVAPGTAPRVELYFGSSDAEENRRHFDQFAARREDLEKRFGGPIEFYPLPNRKACRIAVTASKAFDVLDLDQHTELSNWLVDTMARFRDATQAVRRTLTAT